MRSPAAEILFLLPLLVAVMTAQLVAQDAGLPAGIGAALEDIRQEKYPEADRKLSDLLAADPADNKAMVYLGYLCSIRGDNVRARELLTRALSRDDRDVAALLILADLYYREKDLDMARELYQRIDGLQPEIQMVNIRLYELTKFEDKELSHRYYLKALQLDRTDLRDFLGLQGSRAKGFPAAVEPAGDERLPARQASDRTNDIVQLFLYDQSPSTNIDEPVSNVIVLAQTKVRGGGGGFRLFRGFTTEQTIGRAMGSLVILLLFWIADRFRRTGRRARLEEKVVFSHYRKKF